MFKKLLLTGLLAIGAITFMSVEVRAISIPSGYTISSKGVRCQYDATGTGNTPTTGICEVTNVTQGVLFCINPTNHKVSGQSSSQSINFLDGVSLGVYNKKNGRTSYNTVENADGVVSIDLADPDAACDASTACIALRQFCINPNWVPVDVVPFSMSATLNVYQCTSTDTCPCDPDPLSGSGLPLCADANTTTPSIIDPWVTKTVSCTLSDPGTLKFGEVRTYTCF